MIKLHHKGPGWSMYSSSITRGQEESSTAMDNVGRGGYVHQGGGWEVAWKAELNKIKCIGSRPSID